MVRKPAHLRPGNTDSSLVPEYEKKLKEFLIKRGADVQLASKCEITVQRIKGKKLLKKGGLKENIRAYYTIGDRVARSLPELARLFDVAMPEEASSVDSEEQMQPKRNKKKTPASNVVMKVKVKVKPIRKDKSSKGSSPTSTRTKATKETLVISPSTKDAKSGSKKKSAKPVGYAAWQKEKIDESPRNLTSKVEEYLREGFTIFKRVLNSRMVKSILHSPSLDGVCREENSDDDDENQTGRMVMRKRKGNQTWMGAVRTIHAHIKKKGVTETVLCPLTTREPGRYDMPLPDEVRAVFQTCLAESQVLDLAHFLCRKGSIRTQDIMLSKPGSSEQAVHTDSSWDGKASVDPRTHYLTILIPLTRQDAKTGGTRVWPRSHRSIDGTSWEDHVEMIEPLLKVGDALVFDGLLSHQGMANISPSDDRYFYYASFASGHDPNTDVTGS